MSMRRALTVCRHVAAFSSASAKAPPSAILADPRPSPQSGKITLYGIPTSRVCKVLMAAEEAGVDVDQVPMQLVPQHIRQPWFLALNPKATLPTIKDGDLVLNESNTIVYYIATQYGKGKEICPTSPEVVATAWQWAEWGESTLAKAQTAIFFGKVRNTYHPAGAFAHPCFLGGSRPGEPTAEELEKLVDLCAKAFHVLDAHLNSHQFIAGESFTFGDITASVQANRMIQNNGYGFEQLRPDNFPAVVAWWKRLCDRPSFCTHVMPRFK